jgi:hypothetical protein
MISSVRARRSSVPLAPTPLSKLVGASFWSVVLPVIFYNTRRGRHKEAPIAVWGRPIGARPVPVHTASRFACPNTNFIGLLHSVLWLRRNAPAAI